MLELKKIAAQLGVETTYGEYIELVESDSLYQKRYEQGKLTEVGDVEQMILYQL